MEPMQQSEKEAEKLKVEVNVDQPGAITTLPPPKPSTDQPLQEWIQPAIDVLSKLPEYMGGFFYSYQKPLMTVGLLVAGIITVKVTVAILDAINDVPLLAPFFEVVGIGYTGWFIYRYLLKVETRKELAEEFKAIKGQLFGNNSRES